MPKNLTNELDSAQCKQVQLAIMGASLELKDYTTHMLAKIILS